MAEQTSISIRFVNQVKDHVEAQRLLYDQSFLAKTDKAFAVFTVCWGVFSIFVSGFQWWTIILFPLALLGWFSFSPLQKWKTKVEFQRNPKFREEYHLTFTRENIHFKTASIDSNLQWTHYEKFIEGPDSFLLMYGKGLYTLVPKRAFHSVEEKNEFRALLQTIFPVLPVSPIAPAY